MNIWDVGNDGEPFPYYIQREIITPILQTSESLALFFTLNPKPQCIHIQYLECLKNQRMHYKLYIKYKGMPLNKELTS